MINRKGFTLTEIMIVMAIISALAAIAMPNYIKFKNASLMEICIANMRQVEDASTIYNLENEDFPSSISDLIPGYMKKEAYCPVGGGSYILQTSPTSINIACPNVGLYPKHIIRN